MTTTLTPTAPATTDPTAPAPGYVLIARQWSDSLAVGPYPTLADAEHAMDHAPLIDQFCEEDSLDVIATSDDPPADYERVIVDLEDEDHTGSQVVEEPRPTVVAAPPLDLATVGAPTGAVATLSVHVELSATVHDDCPDWTTFAWRMRERAGAALMGSTAGGWKVRALTATSATHVTQSAPAPAPAPAPEPEAASAETRGYGIPIMFDMAATDRAAAAVLLSAALVDAQLTAEPGVESWWFPEVEDRHAEGTPNDGTPMALVETTANDDERDALTYALDLFTDREDGHARTLAAMLARYTKD